MNFTPQARSAPLVLLTISLCLALFCQSLSADCLDHPGVYLVKAKVQKVTEIIKNNEASIVALKAYIGSWPPMTEVALLVEDVLLGPPELLGKQAYYLAQYYVYPGTPKNSVSPLEFGEVGLFLVEFRDGHWCCVSDSRSINRSTFPCIQWRAPDYEELLQYCTHRRDHPEPGMSPEGKRLVPVVIATVEKVSLNNASAIGGQSLPGIASIYRVQLSITEVLRGPQDLVGKKFFTLCKNGPAHFDEFKFLALQLQPGDEGMFALSNNPADGLWYDVGLGTLRDPKDPLHHFPPRAIRRFQPDYARIVSSLRDLRDHPEKKPEVPTATFAAESKSAPFSTATAVSYFQPVGSRPWELLPAGQPAQAPVVLAAVERMTLNKPDAVGGQRPSDRAPIFRVRLRVTEVLRGPQDLLDQKIYTLVSADADHPLCLVIHRVLLGEQCKFVLYKERDGAWYDMGLVDPREKHDPWLDPPRLFEAADRQWFAFALNNLRERRENEKLLAGLQPMPTSAAPPPSAASAISWYYQVVACSAAVALMLGFFAWRHSR